MRIISIKFLGINNYMGGIPQIQNLPNSNSTHIPNLSANNNHIPGLGNKNISNLNSNSNNKNGNN